MLNMYVKSTNNITFLHNTHFGAKVCFALARQHTPSHSRALFIKPSFVGIFRGALMAATCLCILAVDFRAFPRRYAKVEAYGTGYMDVGVGGVILTAGLVSPAGLAHPPLVVVDGSDVKDGGTRRWRPPPLWRRLLSGLRAAKVCWLLGLGRLVVTRAVDYQEHVGEYGVHWNFFATIAVVALLGHAVALPPQLLAPVAITLTLGHQAVLSWGGLGSWVMSAERGDDVVSLNKEGLISCVGFWALYLWGAALAHAFHASVQHAVRNSRRCSDTSSVKGGGVRGDASDAIATVAPLVRWWAQFVLLDVLLWVAVAALEVKVERISRRQVLQCGIHSLDCCAVSGGNASPHAVADAGVPRLCGADPA
ncbi:hypothetical protein Vafri_12991 [Volvox africanus]|nr:hypothetical protein Vafri_12991 [Volvox africanus]